MLGIIVASLMVATALVIFLLGELWLK